MCCRHCLSQYVCLPYPISVACGKEVKTLPKQNVLSSIAVSSTDHRHHGGSGWEASESASETSKQQVSHVDRSARGS